MRSSFYLSVCQTRAALFGLLAASSTTATAITIDNVLMWFAPAPVPVEMATTNMLADGQKRCLLFLLMDGQGSYINPSV